MKCPGICQKGKEANKTLQTVSLLKETYFILLNKTLFSCKTCGFFTPVLWSVLSQAALSYWSVQRVNTTLAFAFTKMWGFGALFLQHTLSLNSRRDIKNSWLMVFCCKADSYNDIYSETAQCSGRAGKEKLGKNKWLVKHPFELCEESEACLQQTFRYSFHYF